MIWEGIRLNSILLLSKITKVNPLYFIQLLICRLWSLSGPRSHPIITSVRQKMILMTFVPKWAFPTGLLVCQWQRSDAYRRVPGRLNSSKLFWMLIHCLDNGRQQLWRGQGSSCGPVKVRHLATEQDNLCCCTGNWARVSGKSSHVLPV